LGAVGVLIAVRAILPPFVVAGVIAYVLDPLVTYLERKRVPRVWGILLAYLASAGVFAALVVFFVPVFIQELIRLGESIPDYAAMLRGMVDAFQWGYRGAALPGAVKVALDETIARLETGLLVAVRKVLDSIISGFQGLLGLLIAPILAYYLLRDMPDLRKGAARALGSNPSARAAEWASLAGELNSILAGFIRGQLLVGIFVFITVTVILQVMNVRFALILGIIAGLGEFIPYFGPILAAIPALVVALVRSPVLAAQVAVLYLVVQQIDSTIVGPKIIGERVGLHPLTVIFAVLAGGYLVGLWGMFLAVPTAGVLKALGRFVYRKYLV
jgi:predicted PurR-regulated permease PerM